MALLCAAQPFTATAQNNVPRPAAKRQAQGTAAKPTSTAMPATAGTGAKPLFVNDMQLPAEDTIKAEQALTHADSLALMTLSDTLKLKKKRDWATWRPNPKRALWLAIVIPGAGQIYNRKYWKLPIVYGGFVGCAYAMRWNNQMYRDYSQAYLDLMDNDPNTALTTNEHFLFTSYTTYIRTTYCWFFFIIFNINIRIFKTICWINRRLSCSIIETHICS